MTSAQSPYPYYIGIAYNSAFFTTKSGSGLSEATANTLYLRKTTTDTVTALETFNGITNYGTVTVADSSELNTQITLTSTPGSCDITLNNGLNIVGISASGIGTTVDGTLGIGTENNITLNSGTGTRAVAVVYHYSDTDNAVAGANIDLNNGA